MKITWAITLVAWAALAHAETPVEPDTRLAPLPREAVSPPDNPSIPAKVALGKRLFFDPILSATGDTACATCHHPDYAFADGRPVSMGVLAEGIGPERRRVKPANLQNMTRNAPSLINVGFNGLVMDKPYDPAVAPMFWDNRVLGLEAQVLLPLKKREEMRGDACLESEAVPRAIERLLATVDYALGFETVFGRPVNSGDLARAIAAYERSLVVPETALDRYLRGDVKALSPLEKQGLEVFHRAGCSLCHNGPMLSDYQLHAIGIVDGVEGRQTFRTPSLRNLGRTGPYMHNGSQRTLEEVLLFYDLLMDCISETQQGGDVETLPPLDPLLQRLNFLPEDHESVLAFLKVRG